MLAMTVNTFIHRGLGGHLSQEFLWIFGEISKNYYFIQGVANPEFIIYTL